MASATFVLNGKKTQTTSLHLTAKEKNILRSMIEQGIMQGGTKRIQFHITAVDGGYTVTKFEYYAKASRSFDCRPESQVPQWHKEEVFQIN